MIIAGTGHRPPKLGGYTDEVCDKLVALATKMLLERFELYIEKKDLIVISGLALGWDQALAVAAKRNLGLTTWGYAPCRNQDSQWPQWSRDKYAEVLGMLDKTVYIYDGDYPGPICMINRDKAMVRDAEVLLALWDGSSGGTGKTVGFARDAGKPVINVWDNWLAAA